jgi:hypothetical protein
MSYEYIGSNPSLGYMDYVNNATGEMLLAMPGVSYDIRAVWDALPIPPADGFWV